MATVTKRVTDLEAWRTKADQQIGRIGRKLSGLEAFVEDEAKLRAINDKQIELLREADEIHARRLRRVARDVGELQRRKRK